MLLGYHWRGLSYSVSLLSPRLAKVASVSCSSSSVFVRMSHARARGCALSSIIPECRGLVFTLIPARAPSHFSWSKRAKAVASSF